MKAKRKLKRLLVASSLALVSSAMLLGTLSNVNPLTNISEVHAEPIHDEYDWYTLNADDTENVYSLELLLSPLPSDYKKINKTYVNSFLNDLIEGAKNIAMAQMDFLSKIENPPAKENEDPTIIPQESSEGNEGTFDLRQRLLGEMIDSILVGVETIKEENRDDFNEAIDNPDSKPGTSFDDASSGTFLKTLLTYMVAYGVGGVANAEEDIATKLGVTVEDGVVTPATNSDGYVGIVGQSLELAYGSGNEEKILEALQTIYTDAMDIKDNEVLKTEAIVEIFDALEDTPVPVDTVVQILGAENTLETVMAIFTDENVSVTAGVHFLNELTNRTMGDLCDSIQDNLIAEGKEGFTMEDIKDAFEASSNAKLMAIFNELDANGLDNIRIILGKPVDYASEEEEEEEPTRAKKVTRASSSHSEHASSSEYAAASSDLVQIIMERLTINDLLIGTKEIDITYQGPRDSEPQKYVMFDRPVDEGGEEADNLQFHTHAFVDFLHALPTMSEIKELPDGEHLVNFRMDLKTVFNPLDPESPGELLPIIYNVTFGFQDKDTSKIRSLAKILDNTFDLTFDYDYGEEQLFWVNLEARNPNFVSNLYSWLLDSGFIKNTDGFAVELFDVLFSDFGDIKDYFLAKTAEDISNDLKTIDYEKAIELLTLDEELEEIFGPGRITTNDVQRALDLLAKLINKIESTSYDEILEYFPEDLGSLSEALDKESIRNLYAKIQDLLEKIDTSKFTIEEIQEITNGQIYDKLNPDSKAVDYIVRIKNKVLSFLNRLPEHMMDKSILDFYQGNGEFEGSLNFALTDSRYEKVLKAIPGFGSELWTIFDGMVTGVERPKNFELSFNAKFNDIYMVTYEWEEDGETKQKSGLLHTGSDVKMYSGLASQATTKTSTPSSVWHWIEKDVPYTIVDHMAGKDVVVIPEYACTIDEITNVSRVYNPSQTDTLTIEADGEYIEEHTIEYLWEKQNDDGEFESFATTQSINVTNVLDSGVYRYTAMFDKDVVGSEYSISDYVTVEITRAPINLGTPTWSPDVTYNASAQKATIVSMENINYVNVAYSNNEHTNAGEYEVTASYTLKDEYEDNYVLSKTSDIHTFKIFKQILDIDDIVWDYSGEPFIYDGLTKNVNVTDYTNKDKVDVSVSNGAFANAGEYQAVASFSIKDEYAQNYELGNVSDDKILDWKIKAVESIRYYDFVAVETNDDNDHNALIHVDEGFLEKPDFHAESNEGTSFEGIEFNSKDFINAPGEIKHGYNLGFTLEGEDYAMSDSSVTIMILIPKEIKDEEFQIVTLDENNNVVKVNATMSEDGKYAVISGEYISKIGFVTAIKPSILMKDNPQASILFGFLLVTQWLFVLATVLVTKKVKRRIKEIKDIFEN